jgi:hypothetical protein
MILIMFYVRGRGDIGVTGCAVSGCRVVVVVGLSLLLGCRLLWLLWLLSLLSGCRCWAIGWWLLVVGCRVVVVVVVVGFDGFAV